MAGTKPIFVDQSNQKPRPMNFWAPLMVTAAELAGEAKRLADLDVAAADYSGRLETECGRPPRLDVVLLGLGENGHTASLFPGTAALEVEDAWAARGRADYEPFDRITLTLPALNAASHVAFLVTGPDRKLFPPSDPAPLLSTAKVWPSWTWIRTTAWSRVVLRSGRPLLTMPRPKID